MRHRCLVLHFLRKTWNEVLKVGNNVTGFREGRWKIAQGVKFPCWLIGVSRFIGGYVAEPLKDYLYLADLDEWVRSGERSKPDVTGRSAAG